MLLTDLFNPISLLGRFVLPKTDLKALGEAEAKKQLHKALQKQFNTAVPLVAEHLAHDGDLPKTGNEDEVIRHAIYWLWRTGSRVPGEIANQIKESHKAKTKAAVLAQIQPWNGANLQAVVQAVADSEVDITF